MAKNRIYSIKKMYAWILCASLYCSLTQGNTLYKTDGFIQTSTSTIYFEKYWTDKSVHNVPLVGVHGGPGSSHHYLLPLIELAKDHPVILYDQSGSYRSRVNDANFTAWNMQHFVKELEEFVDALGYEKLILFGHSWGAMLSVAYTAQHPEKVTKLILAGPCLSSKIWAQDCRDLAQSLSPQLAETLTKHEAEQTTDHPDYAQAAAVFYDNFFCRQKPYPEYAKQSSKYLNREVYQTMWGPYEMSCIGNLQEVDVTPELSKITVPVLCISGQYDMVTAETLHWYAQHVANATVSIIPDSAHLFIVEKPEETVSAIRVFLS